MIHRDILLFKLFSIHFILKNNSTTKILDCLKI
ncbi:uncharacterized protein METZ01_LOCUS391686 [marine metagenome]|uniref:Uncharacterized protein n=1 Tax=marine metagenome TaxID=408172 RepID=A0A382UX36_9ZZZZ